MRLHALVDTVSQRDKHHAAKTVWHMIPCRHSELLDRASLCNERCATVTCQSTETSIDSSITCHVMQASCLSQVLTVDELAVPPLGGTAVISGQIN
jgi:hypothetical protein